MEKNGEIGGMEKEGVWRRRGREREKRGMKKEKVWLLLLVARVLLISNCTKGYRFISL